MRYKNRLFFSELSICILLLILAIVCLSTILWSVDKGFDFSDEGYYLMGYKYFYEVKKNFTLFQPLVMKSFFLSDISIIGIRILRIILTTLSTLLFSYGVYRFLVKNNVIALNKYIFLQLIVFLQIGSMLSFAFGPLSLSYNSLSLVLIQAATGFFLYNHSVTKNKLFSIFISVLTGFLLFALMLVKVSNTPLLAFFFLLFIIFKNNKISFNALLLEMGAYLLGAFLFIFIYFGSFEGFVSQISEYIETIRNLDNHGAKDQITKYFSQTIYLIKTVFFTQLLFLVILNFLFAIVCKRFAFNNCADLKVLFNLLCLAALLWYNKLYIVYPTHLYIIGILFLGIILLIKKNAINSLFKNRELMLFLLLMLLMPFVGALGSANNIYIQIAFYMSFWFVVFFLLIYKVNTLTTGNKGYLFTLLFTSAASFQIVYKVIFEPYRLNQNLFYQTEEIQNLKNASGIKFDKPTKNMLVEINELLSKKTRFISGDPIFTFSHEIGIAYLLDGVIPGLAWYENENASTNCFYLSDIKKKIASKVIFIIPEDLVLNNELVQCFQRYGITYPANYENIGNINCYKNNQPFLLSIIVPKGILK